MKSLAEVCNRVQEKLAAGLYAANIRQWKPTEVPHVVYNFDDDMGTRRLLERKYARRINNWLLLRECGRHHFKHNEED